MVGVVATETEVPPGQRALQEQRARPALEPPETAAAALAMERAVLEIVRGTERVVLATGQAVPGTERVAPAIVQVALLLLQLRPQLRRPVTPPRLVIRLMMDPVTRLKIRPVTQPPTRLAVRLPMPLATRRIRPRMTTITITPRRLIQWVSVQPIQRIRTLSLYHRSTLFRPRLSLILVEDPIPGISLILVEASRRFLLADARRLSPST
jgi:hypothetical protein